MHHDHPSGVSQTHRVGMMRACSTGEIYARPALMRHDVALSQYAVLKRVKLVPPIPPNCHPSKILQPYPPHFVKKTTTRANTAQYVHMVLTSSLLGVGW